MPGSNSGLTSIPTSGVRAIVEPLGLDGAALGDSDFSALSLQHTTDQFSNSELENINFQSELELDNITSDDAVLMDEYETGEDVIVASEETIECVEIDGTVDQCEYLYEDEEPQSILPEMEDDTTPIIDTVTEEEEMEVSVEEELLEDEMVEEPVTSPTPVQPSQQVMLIQSPTSSGQQIVSGGQIIGRVNSGGGVTLLQQSTLKRPAIATTTGGRNMFAKVIISGSQQGQPIMLSTTQAGSAGHQTTRAITLAQAQQMGLISPSKLQQILPSSSKQGTIKIMSSPLKHHPKIVMQSSTLKSPTKILPAPMSQLKTVTSTTTVKPGLSPQKVFIRQAQGPYKTGTVLGTSGQVIRIPASHGLTGNVTPIQMARNRPVQYVRLVSAGSSSGTTTTITRPRMVAVSSASGAPRPVAITSVRGVGQQMKVVPIAPATPTIRLASPKGVAQPGQRILIPSQAAQMRTASGAGQTIMSSGARNITYMLPAQYVQQVRSQVQSPALPVTVVASATPTPTATQASAGGLTPTPDGIRGSQTPRLSIETNGIRPRKPCNCTKSQCLKLYCDCFANGEFCYMCNCNNCYNNLQHEEERQTAIKSCLERNTTAFRPKIGKSKAGDERRHNKGCNCKRSGCLKNYCECYEAKISCSNNCKCVGCRNVEEPTERNALRDLADAAESRVYQMALKREQASPNPDKNRVPSSHTIKPQFTFVTSAVVSATVECLAAIAEEAEANQLNETEAERLMLEEFGRCLKQVIFISDRADAALTESSKSSASAGLTST